MKRNAKQNGSGGRLRLGLLLATAVAILLVPAAAASAAENFHLKVKGEADGRVISDPEPEGLPDTSPLIDCEWAWEAEVQSGVCNAEASVSEPGGPLFAALEAVPPKGSELEKWVMEGETSAAPTYCGEGALKCRVYTFGSELKVRAVFKQAPPKAYVTINGGGSGSVKGAEPAPGIPPIECSYASPGPETGACEAAPIELFAGLFAINLHPEAAPGSEFAGWTVVKGNTPEESCPEMSEECFVFLAGSYIEVEAKFELEPVPSYPLTLGPTTGSGSGSFKCDSGSGEEPCQAEYEEGTVVEVIPHAAVGSEFVEFTGDCSGSSCSLTMDEGHSASAVFDLQMEEVSVSQTGEGAVTCEDVTAAGSPGACTEYPYGHTIKVVATPTGENVVGSLSGSGSAEGNCDPETGMCEFTITEASGISVTFIAGSTIATQNENVHGKVPQTTELATTCGNDVDLGEFIPGEAANHVESCGLTVTATGSENTLTAADESGEGAGRLGHLVQPSYSLPQALETKATGIPSLAYPGEGGGVFAPLTSPVTLLTYGGPVSADNVTLTFRQKIGLHDALHTGVYSKTITLTLKQTAL